MKRAPPPACRDRAPPPTRDRAPPASNNSFRIRNDWTRTTTRALVKRAQLLPVLLTLFASPAAHAQTLGGSCASVPVGSVTVTGVDPGYILVCNGTDWVLGAQFNSNGQVGIGQSSPQAALDVNGGVRVGSDSSCGLGNAGEIIYTGGNVEYCNGSTWITFAAATTTLSGVDVLLLAGSAAAPSLTFNADTQTGIYQPAAHTMAITTNGIESVAFDASGNLNLVAAGAAYEINSNPVLLAPSADTATSIAVGIGALASDTTGNSGGSHNTALGYDALNAATTGTNTALGYLAGEYISTASTNTAIGTNAMVGVSASPLLNGGNTAVGDSAMFKIQGASSPGSTAVGASALYSIVNSPNTALGYKAGEYITLGIDNVAIGFEAMQGTSGSPVTGGQNIAMGDYALFSLQGLQSNTALGYSALYSTTTGNYNTAVGSSALYYDTTGGSNTALGRSAMSGVAATPLTGSSNTGVGYRTLAAIQGAAANNTSLGYEAGEAVTTGTDNTLLGYTAGSLVTGNSNIIVGEAGNITTGGSNILIGNNLSDTTAGTSDQLDIGDLITGTIGSSYVGINTTTYEGAGLTLGKTSGLYLMGSTSGYIGFTASAASGSQAYTLPPAYPGANAYLLSSTTAGVMSWIPAATPNLNNVDVELAAGSATAPSLTFYTDTQTGIYQPAAHTMGITTNGIESVAFDASGNLNLIKASGAYEINSNPVLVAPSADTGHSIAVGIGALASDTTGNSGGSDNTALGYDALNQATTGTNSALGYQAGEFITTGSQNTALGTSAMLGVAGTPLTGSNNTAVGDSALIAIQGAAQFNTAIGSSAMWQATTGSSNTALGYADLGFLTTGSQNTAIGYGAVSSGSSVALTGSFNTGVGAYALYYLQGTAQQNTATGGYALFTTTTGSYNTATGADALENDTTGSHNTALGRNTMFGVAATPLTGGNNTAVGDSALYAIQGAATKNTALGYEAGNDVTSGTDNTLLGYTAGSLVTGNSNIIVGEAGNITTGGSNILIGNNLSDTTAGTSNQLDIGDTIFGALEATSGGTALTIGAATDDGAIMTFAGEGAITLPVGSTSVRPTAAAGMVRYNSTTFAFEGYGGSTPAWGPLTTSTGITGTIGTSGSGLTVELAAGSATAPSLTFNEDTQTGIYQPANHTMAITTNGIESVAFDASGNLNLIKASGAYEINSNPVLVAPSADTDHSIAVGIGALASDTTGNSGGSDNTAVGYDALNTATTGTNTALGYLAGEYISTGSANTALGTNALLGASATPLTGGSNTAVGDSALEIIRGAAADNTAVGQNALSGLTTGQNATAVGYNAMGDYSSGTGGSTAVGYQALANITTATDSAFGYLAGQYITSGSHNTALGTNAMVGVSATPLTASANTAVGDSALNTIQGGAADNVAVGYGAGQYVSTGSAEVAIGEAAMSGVSATPLTGNGNTAIGQNTLDQLQGTAAANTVVGFEAGTGVTTSAGNTGVGSQALAALGIPLTGNYNTAMGYKALWFAYGAAANNTALGSSALYSTATGTDNTAIGYQAGYNVTGNSNIIVGEAGNITSGSSNILIGNNLSDTTAGSSSQLDIGDLITGTIGSSEVGINTTTYEGSGLTLGTTSSLYLMGSTSGYIGLTASAASGSQAYTLPAGYPGASTYVLTSTTAGVMSWAPVTANLTNVDVYLAAGSATAPSLTFNADTQTGIYQPAAHTMAITTNGIESVAFDASGNINLIKATGAYEINSNPVLAIPAADTTYSLAVGNGVLTSDSHTGGSFNGEYNTGVGYQAEYTNGTGYDNTALGTQSLYANSVGFDNTGVGVWAGYYVTGNYNTVVGNQAMQGVSATPLTGGSNSALGAFALGKIQGAATENTGLGYAALYSATTGTNSALGYSAGSYITTGSANTAIGTNTMVGVSATPLTGNNNTAVGDSALLAIQGAAAANTAVGSGALAALTTSGNSTAVGYDALESMGAGAGTNSAFGYQAGQYIGAANQNTAIGKNAMLGVSATPLTNNRNTAVGDSAMTGLYGTSHDNTALGYNAGGGLTTGVSANVAIGSGALAAAANNNNTAVGDGALASTTNASNTAVGFNSLEYDTSGTTNTAVGAIAMEGVSATPLTGSDNTAVGGLALTAIQGSANGDTALGYGALSAATTDTHSTAVGANALVSQVGGPNSALGYQAGQYITSGTANTAIGTNAMVGVSATPLTGSDNVAVGDTALTAIQGAATKNTVLGFEAGTDVTSGTDNTLLGYIAGHLVTGNSNIIVGEAGNITTGGSNILIGNSLSNTTAGSSSQLDIGDLITGAIGSSEVGINSTTYQGAGLTIGKNSSLYFLGSTSSYVEFSPSAASGSQAYTLPAGYPGSATYVLTSTTAGVMSWAPVTASLNNVDVYLAAGSATAPSLTFNADTQTGIYQPAAHTMGITTNGIESLAFDASGNINLIKASGAYEINSNPVLVAPSADTGHSIAVGIGALASDTTGNSGGSDNTAVGFDALNQATTGTNSALGYQAGEYISSGSANTAIGKNAMVGVAATPLTSSNNTAVGDSALKTIQGAANSNTAVGYAALTGATTDTDNTAVGFKALFSQAAATGTNTALGYQAAEYLTTGRANTAIGNNALVGVSATPLTGNNNTGVGDGVMAHIQGAANNNTAVGNAAMTNLTTGSGNVAMGLQALSSLTTGGGDTALGYEAENDNTTGTNNTAVGQGALYDNVTGTENTAVGYNTLNAVTSGPNSALGQGAGAYITSGTANTAIGFNTMAGVAATPLTGNGNTAVGDSALNAIQGAATDNTAVGQGALTALTTGSPNTAVGYLAGEYITTGVQNVAIGDYAMLGVAATPLTGTGNVAVGHVALTAIQAGASYNEAIGDSALAANTTGGGNAAIGLDALANNTTGSNNFALGTAALPSNQSGGGNIAIGTNSLYATTSSNNIGLGGGAGYYISSGGGIAIGLDAMAGVAATPLTGNGNIAVGVTTLLSIQGAAANNTGVGTNALYYITTGNENTAMGAYALDSVSTGGDNTAVGLAAMQGVAATPLTGGYNTAIGQRALFNIQGNSGDNVALGVSALNDLTVATRNTSVGTSSLDALTTGGSNVAVGWQAGTSLTTGSGNIFVGVAGNITTGSSNILIGNNLSDTTAGSSSQLDIGDLITGAIGSSEVGINTTTYEGTGLTLGTTSSLYLMGSTSGYIGFTASAASGSQAYTLPAGYPGASTYVLTSTTAGVMSWAPVTASLNNVDVYLAAGSATAPSLTFNADTQTGIYQPAAHTMGITANGIESVAFDASGNLNLIKASGAYEINSNPVLVAPSADTATSIAVGIGALASDTTGNSGGSHNTGAGYDALTNATTGTNSALGYQAGANITSGTNNTAIGFNSMVGVAATPLTGGQNTAVGDSALAEIRGAAASNTAVGYQALGTATTSSSDTAVGLDAGFWISTGNANTAIGYSAMFGVAATPLTGFSNTAVGEQALENIQGTGQQNTAMGYNVLYDITTGADNTAIGENAGHSATGITTGSNDTFIGYDTGSNSATYTNSTALGAFTEITASNQIRIGCTSGTNSCPASVSSIGGPTTWTSTSDRRLKKDIRETDLGLDFIEKLRPVSFYFKSGDGKLNYGFIAQDVQEALGKRDTHMVIRESDTIGTYMLTYDDLLSPVVKSIQQQQQEITDDNAALKQLIAAQEKEIEELRQQIRNLTATPAH